jgi:hypothetical protein
VGTDAKDGKRDKREDGLDLTSQLVRGPHGNTFSVVGTTCRSVTGPHGAIGIGIFVSACETLQAQATATFVPGFGDTVQCHVPATATCPGGITSTNGQCITKPVS